MRLNPFATEKKKKKEVIERAEKMMDTKPKRKKLLSRAYDKMVKPTPIQKKVTIDGTEYGY